MIRYGDVFCVQEKKPCITRKARVSIGCMLSHEYKSRYDDVVYTAIAGLRKKRLLKKEILNAAYFCSLDQLILSESSEV